MLATLATDVPEGLRTRLAPLVDILRRAHGEGLRAVIAYGPAAVNGGTDKRQVVQALVIMADASAANLMKTSAEVGQLRRGGVEPLFMSAHEIAASLDVFPLEFLDMQATRVVIHGDDLLAGLQYNAGPLRLQVEEDLRCASHWLRQEVARYGHRPQAMRTVLAQSFLGLQRAWRGLVALSGEEVPGDSEALLRAAAQVCGVDGELLTRLHRLETGSWRPEPTELPQLVTSYDTLLCGLIDRVDRWDPTASAAEDSA